MNGARYSFTQPICDDCWDETRPESPSPHRGGGPYEHCAYCGLATDSGIYVRVDPSTVRRPTRLK